MRTNYIRLVALCFCLLLGTLSMQAARLNGIRIESGSGPVVVYVNGEQVCTASGSCFIANLSGGYYEIEVYEARLSGRTERDQSAGLILDERIYYSGMGVKDIFVKGDIGHRPSRPEGRPHLEGGMSRDTFEAFYRTFKEASFDSDRHKLLDTALLTSYFTSGQCRRIVDLYTFDSEKTKVMQKMYPRISDKESFFMVIEAFTFQMDKDKMNDFVKKYHTNRN